MKHRHKLNTAPRKKGLVGEWRVVSLKSGPLLIKEQTSDLKRIIDALFEQCTKPAQVCQTKTTC